MKYFLDTNIIIYFIKGQFPAIKEHFRGTPMQSIVIPSVVIAEIEYGARKSINYEKTISIYKKFTDNFIKVPFTLEAAIAYGKIRSDLERQGQPIGANDLFIASTVLSEGGILVTHNLREFSRIRGLKLEDWTII